MFDRCVELAQRFGMTLAIASREDQTHGEDSEQRHENRRQNQDLRSMRNRRRHPMSERYRSYMRRRSREVVQHPVEVGPALKIVVARALHPSEQRRVAG